MSDRNERACTRCGSLLHHEDNCPTHPPMPIYDKAFFIAKFEAIPDDQWCSGSGLGDNGERCALTHCSVAGAQSVMGAALADLFPDTSDGGLLTIAAINDGLYPRYKQATPKARVLAALRDLPEPKTS